MICLYIICQFLLISASQVWTFQITRNWHFINQPFNCEKWKRGKSATLSLRINMYSALDRYCDYSYDYSKEVLNPILGTGKLRFRGEILSHAPTDLFKTAVIFKSDTLALKCQRLVKFLTTCTIPTCLCSYCRWIEACASSFHNSGLLSEYNNFLRPTIWLGQKPRYAFPEFRAVLSLDSEMRPNSISLSNNLLLLGR